MSALDERQRAMRERLKSGRKYERGRPRKIAPVVKECVVAPVPHSPTPKWPGHLRKPGLEHTLRVAKETFLAAESCTGVWCNKWLLLRMIHLLEESGLSNRESNA